MTRLLGAVDLREIRKGEQAIFYHSNAKPPGVAGIWILWRRTTDWQWAINGRALIGWILVGFGLFNLEERGELQFELRPRQAFRQKANVEKQIRNRAKRGRRLSGKMLL